MLDFLQQSVPLAVGTALIFGLLVGSFLNVVIHRVPRMMEREWQAQAAELRGETYTPDPPRYNLVVPGSHCPSCRQPIGALQNIPLLSWLAQRGRCRHCGVRISARYPLVELLTGLLFGVAAWHFGLNAAGAGAMLFSAFLVALTFIDIDTQMLPDDLTLPLLWLGLLFNLWGVFAPLNVAVVGAVAGYLSLWSIYWLFKLIRGKEGMGYGDFKLLAAIGAWLGWSALPGVIILSAVVGAVCGIVLMLLARRGFDMQIPYGPYLAGAGLIALYFPGPLRALLQLPV